MSGDLSPLQGMCTFSIFYIAIYQSIPCERIVANLLDGPKWVHGVARGHLLEVTGMHGHMNLYLQLVLTNIDPLFCFVLTQWPPFLKKSKRHTISHGMTPFLLQWRHPEGFFLGGGASTWSRGQNTILRGENPKICREWLIFPICSSDWGESGGRVPPFFIFPSFIDKNLSSKDPLFWIAVRTYPSLPKLGDPSPGGSSLIFTYAPSVPASTMEVHNSW